MLFKMKCAKENDEENFWFEEYDKDTKNPEELGKSYIECFNNTLRPGEKRRVFLGVEIIDANAAKDHNWVKRTGGMSVMFRGEIVDLVYCSRCGITGKRYGLSHIRKDSKYSQKVYERCDTSKLKRKI